jgi:hypothetical protein
VIQFSERVSGPLSESGKQVVSMLLGKGDTELVGYAKELETDYEILYPLGCTAV